jgi:RNA polymerase sigma-70 factor (ECF subfamily)
MQTPALSLENAALISDEDIVRRVVAGETLLFELLIRRHNQRIYRAARAILGSEQDVEDVMQQAYLNAYRHLGSFAGEARFSTWLTSIAVNEALARRRRAAMTAVPEETIIELKSSEPDPERKAMSNELKVLVEREILKLPESYRIVLVLRQIEELSTEETAAILGVSTDVVKQRLRRARVALRDALQLGDLFPFGATRCDRVVAAVMSRLENDRTAQL